MSVKTCPASYCRNRNKAILTLLFIKHTGNKKGRKRALTQHFNKIFHYIKRAEEVKTKNSCRIQNAYKMC